MILLLVLIALSMFQLLALWYLISITQARLKLLEKSICCSQMATIEEIETLSAKVIAYHGVVANGLKVLDGIQQHIWYLEDMLGAELSDGSESPPRRRRVD